MGLVIHNDGVCDSCGRGFTLYVDTGQEPIVNDGRCQRCFDEDRPRTSSAIFHGLLLFLSFAIIFYLIAISVSCLQN